MKILSIQSAVAFGHVGNSAAVFPVQRMGIEVIPVHTVNFSNHTGYGAWRGPLISPHDVHEVVAGIEDRGDLLVSTLNSGEGELQLVESQSAYAHPMMQSEVTQLR